MRESAPRRQRVTLLSHDPQSGRIDMATLAGVAAAIEHAAAHRYAELAERMTARGEHATAAALRTLEEEAAQHAAPAPS